ncbi:glycosyltransferase [Methylophilaceae bacterium]|nr:glycosyltransferase [Methylophilaceae bacterium]
MNSFSIIIPCFNGAKTIRRTLLSVRKQTYEKYEVIIINDGSNDHSLKIIKEIASKDSRLKILNFKKNKGLSHARNNGLAFATGRYICFLDADDWWPSKKLEIFLRFFNKGYDLLYSDYTRINEVSGKLKRINTIKHLEYKHLLSQNPIPLSSSAFDRKSLGIIRFKMNILSEDWVFWLDLFKKNPKPLGINKNLMFYSVTQNAMSSNKFKMAIAAWFIFREYHGHGYLFSSFLIIKYTIKALKKRL